jgi:hypothetical protein
MENVINDDGKYKILSTHKTAKQSRDEIMGEFGVNIITLSEKLGHKMGESDIRFYDLAGLKLIAYELMRMNKDRLITHKPFHLYARDIQGLLPMVSSMIDEKIADIKHHISVRDGIKNNTYK